jgi:hypothetical protein
MGNSCFPISPAPRNNDFESNIIDKNDQIIKIAEIIETDAENIRDP